MRASVPLTIKLAAATRCPGCIFGVRELWADGGDLFGVDAQIGERRFGLLYVKLTVARQARKRGSGNIFRVDFEMFSQMFAIVAAAESVGAQRLQASGQPGSELIGHSL